MAQSCRDTLAPVDGWRAYYPRRPASGPRRFSDHSTLMFESFITFTHLPVSDLMNASYSSGVEGAGSLLVARMRVRMSGVFRISVISLFSLMMIACGVPVRVTSPNDPSASHPGRPLSAEVGMSGAM